MKNFLIKFAVLMLMTAFTADTLSYVIGIETRIQVTEEHKEDKAETEKENLKDKINFDPNAANEFFSQSERSYVHYSSTLPRFYLSRIDLPPDLI